jgi:hypothetical protein
MGHRWNIGCLEATVKVVVRKMPELRGSWRMWIKAGVWIGGALSRGQPEAGPLLVKMEILGDRESPTWGNLGRQGIWLVLKRDERKLCRTRLKGNEVVPWGQMAGRKSVPQW